MLKDDDINKTSLKEDTNKTSLKDDIDLSLRLYDEDIVKLQIMMECKRLEYENTCLRRELYKLSNNSRTVRLGDMVQQVEKLKGKILDLDVSRENYIKTVLKAAEMIQFIKPTTSTIGSRRIIASGDFSPSSKSITQDSKSSTKPYSLMTNDSPQSIPTYSKSISSHQRTSFPSHSKTTSPSFSKSSSTISHSKTSTSSYAKKSIMTPKNTTTNTFSNETSSSSSLLETGTRVIKPIRTAKTRSLLKKPASPSIPNQASRSPTVHLSPPPQFRTRVKSPTAKYRQKTVNEAANYRPRGVSPVTIVNDFGIEEQESLVVTSQTQAQPNGHQLQPQAQLRKHKRIGSRERLNYIDRADQDFPSTDSTEDFISTDYTGDFTGTDCLDSCAEDCTGKDRAEANEQSSDSESRLIDCKCFTSLFRKYFRKRGRESSAASEASYTRKYVCNRSNIVSRKTVQTIRKKSSSTNTIPIYSFTNTILGYCEEAPMDSRSEVSLGTKVREWLRISRTAVLGERSYSVEEMEVRWQDQDKARLHI